MDTANATIDSAMNGLGSILMLIGGVAFSAPLAWFLACEAMDVMGKRYRHNEPTLRWIVGGAVCGVVGVVMVCLGSLSGWLVVALIALSIVAGGCGGVCVAELMRRWEKRDLG